VEVLAHGSGIDELAIFLFPVFFGGGLWLLTRKRRSADDEPAEPVLGSAIGGASEAVSPPAGATRLHLLMGGQQSEPDSSDTSDAQPA
jgi:hypothetical protein